MPTQKGYKRTLTVWLDNDLVNTLRKLAHSGDVSISKLTGRIIESAVTVLEVFEGMGFSILSLVIRDLREGFKSKKEKGGRRATTIWVSKQPVRRIDTIAQKLGLSRSRLVMYIVHVGVAELKNTPKKKRLGQAAVPRVFRSLEVGLKKKMDGSIKRGISEMRSPNKKPTAKS